MRLTVELLALAYPRRHSPRGVRAPARVGIASWTGTYVAAFQSCSGFLSFPALLLLRHTSSHRALSDIFARERTVGRVLAIFSGAPLITCPLYVAVRSKNVVKAAEFVTNEGFSHVWTR